MQRAGDLAWPAAEIGHAAVAAHLRGQEIEERAIERLSVELVKEMIGICTRDAIVSVHLKRIPLEVSSLV